MSLYEFLEVNQLTLVERYSAGVAARLAPRPVPEELGHAIPQFLEQLIRALRLEQSCDGVESCRASAVFGSTRFQLEREMGVAAARHGHELLVHGLSAAQVVHDYGAFCQAIIELAVERNEAISGDAFGTLARCLDHAIASAVTEFCQQHGRVIAMTDNRSLGERLAPLAQELRNLINTAMPSFVAIKEGGVGLQGATSAVLEKSLTEMHNLIEQVLTDVSRDARRPLQLDAVAAERFLAEVQLAASLEARSKGCEFTVFPVEPGLAFHADKQKLHSALFALLQNAFRFTRPQSHVWLRARGVAKRVLIEVEDQCGGLSEQRDDSDLGLSVSRLTVEGMGGSFRVHDIPEIGCVFTIDLPRRVEAPIEQFAEDTAGHSAAAIVR